MEESRARSTSRFRGDTASPWRYGRWLAMGAIVLLLGGAATASATFYDGREFVVGFLPGLDEGAGVFAIELQLASDLGTTATVEYPMGAPTFSRTVYVPAASVLTVQVPLAAATGWQPGDVRQNAIRVFAPDPSPATLVVTMVNRVRFSSDSALALPADRLGLDHVVVAPDPTDSKPSNQFLVIARDPGTEVTIIPTTDMLPAHPTGVPFTVTLDAGEGFLGRPQLGGAFLPLSGTIVTADRPVTVVNGEVCAQVPPGTSAACDTVFEVAVPTERWGQTLPVHALAQRPEGSIYRVLASQNATSVLLDGLPWVVLNRGEYATTGELPGPHLIEGDRPIFAVQVMTGGSLGLPLGHGDPAMGNILPAEHYGRSRVFATVGPGQFPESWISIIATDADVAAGAVTLDGSPVPATAFVPIGADFSAALQAVGPGTHRSTARAGHHVTVLGTNTFDSYLHPVPGPAPREHFLCRRIARKNRLNAVVALVDDLGQGDYEILAEGELCAPADKNAEGLVDPEPHFVRYRVRGTTTPHAAVDVTNQFGTVTLDLKKTSHLMVQAAKIHPPAPPPAAPAPARHYRCLDARVTRHTVRPPTVTPTVGDQFGGGPARVRRPKRLCISTDKNGEGNTRTDDVLLCYVATVDEPRIKTPVLTADQFATRRMEVTRARELCVPSTLTRGDCCVPRPSRCQIGGTDAGPCDLPALASACAASGGLCRSFTCEQRCGNGVLEPWCCEECDDGTTLDGDQCSRNCKVQPCCIPQPTRCQADTSVPCDDDTDCAAVGGECVSFDCEGLCGNGVVEDFCCEPCDDGHDCNLPCPEDPEPCTPAPCRCISFPGLPCTTDTDCPSGGCVCYDCPSLCGNGDVDTFCCEECDAGDPLGGAECSPECRETVCNPQPCRCQGNENVPCLNGVCPTGEPCICYDCASRCGNGAIEPWCCEDCDDGTRLDGDGCSATCRAQDCCVPQPTRCADAPEIPCDEDEDCPSGAGACLSFSCAQACGDALLQSFCCEQCDDGTQCYAYAEGLAGKLP